MYLRLRIKSAIKYGTEIERWFAKDNRRTDAASVRTQAGKIYTV
jgi:hypothetical protein